MTQTTSHILMIRPVNFTYNAETAVNNAFQVAGNAGGAQERALKEFNHFVQVLIGAGIDVTVVDDSPEPHTPDSIFPNNWISFHEDGTVVLYPMYAANRRLERKPAVLEAVSRKFIISKTIDLSNIEKEHRFLEGTGSMTLDRVHKIAYACLSPRTDKDALLQFCQAMKFEPLLFSAVDEWGRAIYHTNVMICVADEYIVACVDSIPDQREKDRLLASAAKTGKALISISFSQMNHFAGNMLQVTNNKNEKLLAMSTQAYDSLSAAQRKQLSGHNRILHAPLDSIETNGGGSARCMMAEVFLPLSE